MYQTCKKLAALKVVNIRISNTDRNDQNENISIIANQARISSVSWNDTCNKITTDLSFWMRLHNRTVPLADLVEKCMNRCIDHMMTSSNGNFSALLAICDGNSPVPGTQRPVTRSFDIFFDLRLNKRLSKQSWGWWFETPSRPLWRQCNEQLNFNMTYAWFGYAIVWKCVAQCHHDNAIKWKHFPYHWPFVRGLHRSLVGFPWQTPVIQSFDVFFELHPNRWLCKQSRRWWFEMLSRPLWRHCYDTIKHDVIQNKRDTSFINLNILRGIDVTYICIWLNGIIYAEELTHCHHIYAYSID